MPSLARTLLALLALTLFTACTAPAASAPAVNPAEVTLTPGTGGLAGQISAAPQRWPDDELTVYAAPFTRTENSEDGFYVLEPNLHPHTLLDKTGAFVIVDMPPGAYVLIVGPNPREGKAVVNNANHAQVFSVEANQLLQAGALTIAP